MKKIHHDVKVGKRHIKLELYERYTTATFDEMSFNRLDELVKHLPDLMNPNFIEPFAVIANFMFNGVNFKILNKIKPKVQDNDAIFYVEEVSTGLHYKVTCPFPYTDPSCPFAYTPL